MTRIVAVLVASAALFGPVLAQPVTGHMTVHDKPVELRHAAAQPYGGPAGGPPVAWKVALTDRPLPEGALDGPEAAGLRLLAYEQKVRGVLLVVEADDPGSAWSMALDAFGTPGLKATLLKIGQPDGHAIEALKVDAKRIAFRAKRQWPIDAVQYDLAIDVPLRPEPAVRQDVQGRDAVRATPMWQAADAQVAKMAKVKASTIATLRAGFGPTSQAQNDVALKHLLGDKEFAELNRTTAKEMRATLDATTRVVDRGRWATIVPADPKARPIELVQDAVGAWRVGM